VVLGGRPEQQRRGVDGTARDDDLPGVDPDDPAAVPRNKLFPCELVKRGSLR